MICLVKVYIKEQGLSFSIANVHNLSILFGHDLLNFLKLSFEMSSNLGKSSFAIGALVNMHTCNARIVFIHIIYIDIDINWPIMKYIDDHTK